MPASGQPWDPLFASRSPLYAPYRPLLEPWLGRPSWPGVDDFGSLVEQQRARRAPELGRLAFREITPRPRRGRRRTDTLEQLYDGSVTLRGEVPCLAASYHDLFNALIFAAYPRAKRALHARQFRALAERVPELPARLPGARSPEQDALTIFDEGGSVLLLTEAQASALRRGDELTFEGPASARAVVFGHAILEHALAGAESRLLRSSALVAILDPLPTPEALLEWLDLFLAERLASSRAFVDTGSDAVLVVHPSGQLCARRGRGAPRHEAACFSSTPG